jgi:hypothetical protein
LANGLDPAPELLHGDHDVAGSALVEVAPHGAG